MRNHTPCTPVYFVFAMRFCLCGHGTHFRRLLALTPLARRSVAQPVAFCRLAVNAYDATNAIPANAKSLPVTLASQAARAGRLKLRSATSGLYCDTAGNRKLGRCDFFSVPVGL